MSKHQTDLERAFAQLYEIQKLLLNGTLPPPAIRGPLQRLIEQRVSIEDRMAVHQPLLTPQQQLTRLTRFNRYLWGGFLSQKQIRNAGYLVGGHPDSYRSIQRLDRLHVLHVEGTTPAHTVELWRKVFERDDRGPFRRMDWAPEVRARHVPQVASGARTYEPGIHLVCLNLVAHWWPDEERNFRYEDPEDAPNATTLRERAVVDEEIVPAHGEALSALGLHTDLARHMLASGLGAMPGQILAGYLFDDPTSVMGLVSQNGRLELGLRNASYLASHNAMPLVVSRGEAGD